MEKKQCVNCWKQLDVNAVICTNCGTLQQNGKSIKEYNAPKKKKSFSKSLLIILILSGIVAGGFHLYKWNKQKASKAASIGAGIPKDETIAPPKPANTKAVVAETLSFPRNISEAENAEQYKMYTSSSIGFVSKKTASGKFIRHGRISLKTRVLPPAGIKGQFRLKIYSGKSANGEYKLIYDRIAMIKQQKSPTHPSMKERFFTLPDKYKNAPEHIKKRFLEARKKSYERMMGGRPERKARTVAASSSAIFIYSNNEFEISPEQDSLYFRFLLCAPEGRVIKESLPKRFAINRPGKYVSRTYDPSLRYGHNSRPPSLDGNTIYLHIYGVYRTLKFAFLEKDAFKITSLSIDGVKYIPVFIGKTSKSIYKDPKTKVQKPYYSSSMSLKYPFGGNVKLKFKYKSSSGKFKKETFSFYLPPPPPLIKVKAGARGEMVKISWDKIESGIDKSHFTKVPQLVLQRNRKEFKRFPVYQQTTCIDKDVFSGEPINYKLLFKDGIFNASLWSSEKGVKKYKVQIREIINQFSKDGVDVIVPSLTKAKHPVRIELLKSSICYENTGIASCGLLEALINGVKKANDMIFYDRDSRNYIIDEKFFALSKSLKKQFQIKESDYAVQIKDYSRRDGNGLELWLFKKRVEGKYARKKTIYWRIADIRIDSDKKNLDKAVDKLIAKIRDTLEFISCEDTRIKNIKPKNVICPTFRPVNQKYVIRNYEAVCESLFLTLGEKSDTVKILSKTDWEQLFNERISRFDEGHNFIDSAVREVLLTGRLWRKGKTKNYYVQACDAFTGEVLGSKVFAGKTQNVAAELALWLKTFKLSDDIKVDFQMSKYYKSQKARIISKPWRPQENLIKNYGPYIAKPRERRTRIRRYQAKRKTAQKESFYVFVKRQWKDGFRAKAIKLLQEELKKSRSFKTGKLLGTYYIESKRYQDAIDIFENSWKNKKNTEEGSLLSSYYIKAKKYRDALAVYDGMLLLDGCPKNIYDNYNTIKAKAAGEKPKRVVVKKEKKKSAKNSTLRKEILVAKMKINNKMDYRATYTSYKKGRAVHTKIPRTEISRSDAIKKYYFIDRDKIYAEWAPKQPCRTATLIFSIPEKLLSQGINSKVVKKYGVWTKALRLAPSDSYNPEFLFRNWRWLPRRPHTTNNRFHTGSSSVAAAEERQMRSVCKPRIIVFEAGWNSINPFAEELDSTLAYTRLGYFFDIHNRQNSLVDHLYHRSRIRAFFELKKKPRISFPKFTFAVNSVRKAFVSQIRTGKDMIRYWALELAEKDRFAKMCKNKLYIRDFELYQMLALNYIVRRESNSTLKRIYRTIKNTPVPESMEEYRKSPVGTDFLVFMAYKKNKKAVRLLHLILDKGGYASDNKFIEYAYVLAQAGYKKLTARMISKYMSNYADLRWLPAEILNHLLIQDLKPNADLFNYLVLGTQNNSAARKWFFGYNGKNLINHYFGKPPAEAYRDWKLKHLKRVKELKNKEKFIK